jgi:hypothetical protein
VYSLYNKPKSFENIIYAKTGHVYTRDMWQKMLAWMKKEL